MKLWKTIGRVAVMMAALAMITPGVVRAEIAAGAQAPQVLDVSLRSGSMKGQLLTAEGTPIRGETISVSKDGREVARATTDDKGLYTVDGLSTGLYQVATSQGAANYRLWSENTAPPSAQAGALMIVGQPVRANLGGGSPLLLGAAAAAIITGVIIAADDDSPSS